MECNNFRDDICRYFEMFKDSGKEKPTGCNSSSGECQAFIDNGDNWESLDLQDCDYLDLEGY